MIELVKFIIDQFAEKKDEVVFDVVEKDKTTKIVVTLAPSDMGKVIGKQGKIAKAIRTLLQAMPSDGKKYTLEICERGETDAE